MSQINLIGWPILVVQGHDAHRILCQRMGRPRDFLSGSVYPLNKNMADFSTYEEGVLIIITQDVMLC